MDCQAFYAKYLADMWEEQLKYGGMVPHVVPNVLDTGGKFPNGAVAWADAATVIPWTVYLHYGDKTILERQLKSMMAGSIGSAVRRTGRQGRISGTGWL
jgi:alpha-L-rhamnosidase